MVTRKYVMECRQYVITREYVMGCRQYVITKEYVIGYIVTKKYVMI